MRITPVPPELAEFRCPAGERYCHGGCDWQCPRCLAVVAHQHYCWRCWLNWCPQCRGRGTVTDATYTWNSPRTVRCPHCSAEAA